MRHPDTERRSLMAAAAQPTPRAEGGRTLDFKLSLYKDGHSALSTMPYTQPLMSNDDVELVAQFALLIRKMRQKIEREATQ